MNGKLLDVVSKFVVPKQHESAAWAKSMTAADRRLWEWATSFTTFTCVNLSAHPAILHLRTRMEVNFLNCVREWEGATF